MSTVPEYELEQHTLQYMEYVKDFASRQTKDIFLTGKKESFRLAIEGKDVYLDFNVGDA